MSAELETAQGSRNELHPSDEKKSKADQLANAGLSTSTANRYEELAGGREQQAQDIASAAADCYFANAQANNEPVSMNWFKAAIRSAVTETLGLPQSRPRGKPPELSPEDKANRTWLSWIMDIDRLEPELATWEVTIQTGK